MSLSKNEINKLKQVKSILRQNSHYRALETECYFMERESMKQRTKDVHKSFQENQRREVRA